MLAKQLKISLLQVFSQLTTQRSGLRQNSCAVDEQACVFGSCALNPKQARGRAESAHGFSSSLCSAEKVSIRKLKLCDFYYILIGLNSEYKPVPWDIHCCHGNAIVEGCLVKFLAKIGRKLQFFLKSFSNYLGLLFVISISKLPPIPNFKQIG